MLRRSPLHIRAWHVCVWCLWWLFTPVTRSHLQDTIVKPGDGFGLYSFNSQLTLHMKLQAVSPSTRRTIKSKLGNIVPSRRTLFFTSVMQCLSALQQRKSRTCVCWCGASPVPCALRMMTCPRAVQAWAPLAGSAKRGWWR